MYRGIETKSADFGGGLVTNQPITELDLSQASDVDNIILSASGKGFRSKLGDIVFNSTPIVGSSTPIQGLAYFRLSTQVDYMLAVGGTKLKVSTNLTGTMTDITGSLTITSGQDNIWSFAVLNNKVVGFGGLDTAPDAPFVWTGSGNAITLGGTPPSAYDCFQANNRIFAMRTMADPSTVFWTVLGDESDWTGVGSGSSDVWTSDNDRLTAHAVINTNSVLLFKENSIHQMQIGALIEGGFPVYTLFSNVGCAGKGAVVVADGLAYFINSRGKMCVTDGSILYTSQEIPALSSIDDQWNQVNPARYKYIQGTRHIGPDFDHIKWFVPFGPSQTTNNRCFIWDRLNKCWLQNTTGSNCNVVANTSAWTLYSGEYDGTIYQKEASATYTEASNANLVINGHWQSGWLSQAKFETIKQPRKMNLSYYNQGGGSVRVDYGFDFGGLIKNAVLSQTGTGGLWDTATWDVDIFGGLNIRLNSFRVVGRGNFFQYKISTPTAAYPLVLNGLSISGKEYGQKDFTAR